MLSYWLSVSAKHAVTVMGQQTKQLRHFMRPVSVTVPTTLVSASLRLSILLQAAVTGPPISLVKLIARH